MTRRIVVGFVTALALAAVARPVAAEVDHREMKAREDFGAGRYQDALDLFVKLYAEKLHPNYLRNIGRCYQNLGDPDKAISSFHEYLRKAKNVTPDERAEVEGYIKEMEDLKKQREQAATPPPPPPVEPLPSVKTPVVTSPPAADPTAPPPPSLTLKNPPPPAEEESHPVYTKWWFWTIIGVVVVGGLGGAAAAGVFTKTKDAPCGGMQCGG